MLTITWLSGYVFSSVVMLALYVFFNCCQARYVLFPIGQLNLYVVLFPIVRLALYAFLTVVRLRW